MPCTQTKWHFACGDVRDLRWPGAQPTVEVCPKHISGTELCQPLKPVVQDVDEDCVDCKDEKAKKGQKRKAGGEA
jgi:hypothetical protein